MNRFQSHHSFSLHLLWKIFSIGFFLLFFAFFFLGIETVDSSTSQEQAKTLERAIRKSVIQCYAVEGSYPPSLEYLQEHYGIFYDSDSFYVDYISIGSNIMPDITIIEKDNAE